MKILKQETDLSLLMWSALNYKGETIYVVAYGLQVTQFNTEELALSEYECCRLHSIACG